MEIAQYVLEKLKLHIMFTEFKSFFFFFFSLVIINK